MAAALMMVDGVDILDRKKVSPTGLGSQGAGRDSMHAGIRCFKNPPPPRVGPILTH